MNISDSPALFALALFWGVALVILFYSHKSRKGKKEKGGHTVWSYLARKRNDLFSFAAFMNLSPLIACTRAK
jgi:hypothetical protein